MSAANSAARRRSRTSGQQPRAVEDQTAAITGPGLRNAENGSEERADADAGLAAVSLNGDAADLDNAELDEFGELDADDADIQAALAEGDLDEPDLSEVASAGDLAGDELSVDAPDDETEGPDALEAAEPEVAAEADTEAEGPEAAGARVVKIAPDGGEDEEGGVMAAAA